MKKKLDVLFKIWVFLMIGIVGFLLIENSILRTSLSRVPRLEEEKFEKALSSEKRKIKEKFEKLYKRELPGYNEAINALKQIKKKLQKLENSNNNSRYKKVPLIIRKQGN